MPDLEEPLVTVVVPTFNEAPNIDELARRLDVALGGVAAEILFVDDSEDNTPQVIEEVAQRSRRVPVLLLHRQAPVGGLSGAVCAGLGRSAATWCVVMDGDLQHPPELVPELLRVGAQTGADIVVASRHTERGSAAGLSGWYRQIVSLWATVLSRALFPHQLMDCSDPMTGFFAVRRGVVELDRLNPRGFKILLEILLTHDLTVAEVPLVMARRGAGTSKASVVQGMELLGQLVRLRARGAPPAWTDPSLDGPSDRRPSLP